ncbi:MAG: hypothetical protein IPK81_06100 [Rhodospirillales bacterium]|nr:MAG: hypothetical protein IPK81_06100 [Rhodospirillales bacterium]
MSAAAHEGGGSQTLLIILAAVDLLLSAVIAAFVLVLVVMGEPSNGAAMEDASAAHTGVTVIETWALPATQLRLVGLAPEPVGSAKPPEPIERLLPASERKGYYELPQKVRDIDIELSNPGAVLQVTAATGETWVIVIACDASEVRLQLGLMPQLVLPECSQGDPAIVVRQPDEILVLPRSTTARPRGQAVALRADPCFEERGLYPGTTFARFGLRQSECAIPKEIGLFVLLPRPQ